MINFCDITNKYRFDVPNHNIDKGGHSVKYNQLFVGELLYLLNTSTGILSTNEIDLDVVDILKLYNFCVDGGGRFCTRINNKTPNIYELILGIKTNQNYVINHIDGDPSNNKRINLELVSQWFNVTLKKKNFQLPIGVRYHEGSYKTGINIPRISTAINFGSKSIDYLQNLHYQFGTKSGLVTPARYLQAVSNWLPDNLIQFTPKHQIKLDLLIAAHIQNQLLWEPPTKI